MLFNSIQFVIFFVCISSLYFTVPQKYRWVLLLLGSCYFYMAFVPVYIIILAFTIFVDYFAGLAIEQSVGKKRKTVLLFSLAANIGVLAIFKYYNFFDQNLTLALSRAGMHNPLPYLPILLPLGLSFHTFQAMSYTIEIYRGRQKAEKHFGIYALYVMFFPQLVAGPIERPQNLLHQFYEKHSFDYERTADALSQILWGFFKKIVIADNLAELVNTVYGNPQGFTGVHFIIATVFFAFQIFCDFSGYSDIALGTARILGFDLMNNFDRPYSATSISDFWKRWHISLSTWLKDYVYIPLGGNRAGAWKTYRNLFITFIISGIWHGANWTFIVWGFIHGTYIVVGSMTEHLRHSLINRFGITRFPRLHKLFQQIIIFCLVCVAWIFFRANSLHTAIYIVTHLFDGFGDFIANVSNVSTVKSTLSLFAVSPITFALMWISILCLLFAYHFKGTRTLRAALLKKPIYLRWGVYYALIFAILFFGSLGKQPFIYFQF